MQYYINRAGFSRVNKNDPRASFFPDEQLRFDPLGKPFESSQPSRAHPDHEK